MAAEDAASQSAPGPSAIRPIVAAAGVGELGVGILAVLFPGPVAGLLLAAPVEGAGLVVVRMVGVSIAALGCTWWMARRQAPTELGRLVRGGFLVYNFGVAIIFAVYARAQDRLLWVPILVAVAHLVIGASFMLAAARSRSALRST